MLRRFTSILDEAADRHGGQQILERKLAQRPYRFFEENLSTASSRWLAAMARCIFNAGFNWRLIDGKWPDFEEAFFHFDLQKVANIDEVILDGLLTNKKIVRHGSKIDSVIKNARWLSDLEAREGVSAAQFFIDWPDENFDQLVLMLKKEGFRLGGNTGQYAMRFSGKQSFIMSKDVVGALQRDKVIDNFSVNKTCLGKIQGAYNQWAEESGHGLTTINRVLAMSFGDIMVSDLED